ncbi:MAG: hypothetical protein ICV51_16410 [Flavisolibacter sp.]|nr:hypothetical protein [Flavisolibacter sp.]MBD0350744.1 hypothetical protein [Flavisolibacter sp.]MBD0366726.1 hypothetical protein [Flavisolibacter sp.]MBD0377196.1 hypothetical protein [Flavisolibacter sp.]
MRWQWGSAEAFNDFAQKHLMPILGRPGLNLPLSVVLPAHNYMGVHAEESISA